MFGILLLTSVFKTSCSWMKESAKNQQCVMNSQNEQLRFNLFRRSIIIYSEWSLFKYCVRDVFLLVKIVIFLNLCICRCKNQRFVPVGIFVVQLSPQ